MSERICDGNRDLRDRDRMAGIARRAAMMDGAEYVLYKFGQAYQFCRTDEYEGPMEKIVETIKPGINNAEI